MEPAQIQPKSTGTIHRGSEHEYAQAHGLDPRRFPFDWNDSGRR